ncbi:putative bifunctional diguanylate cyclase/phosphodiesterase [Asticcacaulis excentricus]|uniref:Diguanylate cyclase/phosphodiesterase n=1 Tax=Asticcacaulis excentricus TaxID=78587 RepID=A0A3G9GB06_9CAUL|nr:bifunctional diguanylate cyclase/phosphodiesterase [Asticcacaulis excentricus]BBF81658.1 diguanylate cyclase/phosphodiesterase [Asticcacaulis excentricus]
MPTLFHPVPYHPHLLRQAYRTLGPMLLVNLACVIGTSFLLDIANHPLLSGWVVMHVTVILIRGGSWARFHQDKRNWRRKSDYQFWKASYAAGLLVSGSLWSALAVYLFAKHPEIASVEAQYAVLIILSALAGGATGVTSSFARAGSVYIGLLLLPASLTLLTHDDTHRTLGLLGLIFLGVMLVTLRGNHRLLVRNLTLEDRNLSLIKQLSEVNQVLEAKVSERTERLARLAHTDKLTGLFNRYGLFDWHQKRIEAEPHTRTVVFFLDLDRFKQVNDALSHEAGDKVLTAIAQQIESVAPPQAKLARWGGDEFVLACPVTGDVNALVDAVSEGVSRAVDIPLNIEGTDLKLGVSIGWACHPDHDKTFSDIVHAADLAATEVKRSGRGRTLAFDETFAESLRRRFNLSRALSEAIGSDALYVAYQPIICARTGALLSYEALCRWDHPELGTIRPDEFIRLAEDTDRIVALGNWVLERACADAVQWRRQGIAAKVAVNVSVKQLTLDTFALHLVSILSRTGLSPACLEIEVTESVFDDGHIEQVSHTIKHLKALGVHIHIDDFGTGYSSLSRLRHLNVSGIKIDQSFVADLSGQSRVIIESTILIARAFGLTIVAEGVESDEQRDLLRTLGVDQLQGYLLGRPQRLGNILGADTLSETAA